ncbi:glycosyltransferase family 2 protein [Nocardioides mesophilus]|uniref:Glycosyltransferase family 2 protein n=1 Tax=Nocardioides mesophilus TaxID=433659 RepID=A0A7G9R818_9ACTN|nr:glycosyltransferase family 2 protein [Nocardioides mesophilus]QNN51743.1 glycosyltransferase family 2 protein [Nocardioides mesophilus]
MSNPGAEEQGAANRPRLAKRHGRAPSGRAEPAVAVLTVARDEALMLPRWLDYYGRQVGLDNLIVFDDNSTDGSTDGLPCTVHRIPGFSGRGTFERDRVGLMSGIADGLLHTYDWVIFTDVDEFLVPDPARHDGLVSFLRSREDTLVIGATGLNVTHHPAVEGPIDTSRPVLGQRRFAKFTPIMCKPSIKQVAAPWAAASHGVLAPFRIDPELYLMHLKFHDRETLRVMAGLRRGVVDLDGRAAASNWGRGADELVSILDEVVAPVPPGSVPEFDPGQVDLDAVIVHKQKGLYRAIRRAQDATMREMPLVRIPERFFGLV